MNLEMLIDTGDSDYNNIVRLYHFKPEDIIQFSEDIQYYLIENNLELELNKSPYIEISNCTLIFKRCDVEKGIYLINENNLVCELNEESYSEMVGILSHYSNDDYLGHNWLLNIAESEFDFLISLGGGW